MTQMYSSSRMDKRSQSFTWNIENLLWDDCPESEYFKSSSFRVKIWNLNTTWHLRVYPSKQSLTIACFLEQCDKTDLEEVPMDFTLSYILSGGNVKTKPVKENCKLSKQKFLAASNDKWLYFNKVKIENSSLYFPGDRLTIRFILWRSSSEKSPLFNYFALTYFEISKVSYTKTVPNLRYLDLERAVRFSPLPYFSLKIKLYLKKNSDYLSVEFQHADTSFRRVRLCCVLSVLNPNGILVQKKEDDYLFPMEKDAIWSFPDFILMKYFSSDGIKLHFKFIVNTGNVRKRICETECLPSCVANATAEELSVEKIELDSIIRGYQDHCIDGKLADIKLISENKTFSTHKSILIAMSPVFANKFSDKIDENEDNSILIEDIDPETLNMLLQFMYTEMVEGLDEEMAKKLLSAADKYQVFSLKHKCAIYLNRHISVQNACLLLQLADSHAEESLKRSVQEFICFHHRNIFETDEWKNFIRLHVELASEVFQQFSRKYLNF